MNGSEKIKFDSGELENIVGKEENTTCFQKASYAELYTTHSRQLMTLYKKLFENIVGKEENAGTSIFFFFHNISNPFQNKF